MNFGVAVCHQTFFLTLWVDIASTLPLLCFESRNTWEWWLGSSTVIMYIYKSWGVGEEHSSWRLRCVAKYTVGTSWKFTLRKVEQSSKHLSTQSMIGVRPINYVERARRGTINNVNSQVHKIGARIYSEYSSDRTILCRRRLGVLCWSYSAALLPPWSLSDETETC